MSHTQVARLEVEWSLSLLALCVRLMRNDLHQRCPVNQGVLISGVLIRGVHPHFRGPNQRGPGVLYSSSPVCWNV